MSLLKKTIVITVLLFSVIEHGFCRDVKDSVQNIISNIDQAYAKGHITKKVYLDSIYMKMNSFLSSNILFTNKEAVSLLRIYRKTIWEDDKDYEHKRAYYVILSTLANFTDRMGEKLYYLEKIEKLELAEYPDRPSLSAISGLAGYYNATNSWEKIIALYEKSKKFINNIPQFAEKEPVSGKELGQSAFFLHFTALAYYNLNQISNGQAVEILMQKIANVAKEKYGNDNNLINNIAHAQYLTAIKGAKVRKDTKAQWKAIQQLEDLRNNATTSDYLKNYINGTLNFWKLDFYLIQHNKDSASHYLNIYRQIVEQGKKLYNLFEYQTFKAKELYNLNQFKESADTLNKAIETLDSSRTLVVQDIDNIQYAQAEAEDKQLLLEDAQIKQKKTEQKLLLVGVISSVLLLAGILIIRIIRYRQQKRFLTFKHNLARNIHDEANPALLYAKALVRTQTKGTDKQKNELEKHIDHTMTLIRSLSHDLRSDKQYTISSLMESVEQLLQKLSVDDSFKYIIHKSANSKRFISHYQYSELKSILNECITNTIKHAEFNKIEVAFTNQHNKLTITYQDNGKGWDTSKEMEGMGIKNIEERSKELNGDFTIQNQYPNGYFVQISILLR